MDGGGIGEAPLKTRRLMMNNPAETTAKSLTGAEAAVEMLKAHGVEIIFGLCGDTSLPFYDALARLPHGMRHILARDERSAAYMADGYARVSGKVGVCEGPSGGGVTYILPGLAEANESSVPLLCINSDISVRARGRFTLTELDQGALMRPVTKWNTVLDRAEDLPSAFREAFRQITTGRPGAAHIALPFDVQVHDADLARSVEHDVRGFEVAMQHAALVRGREPGADLPRDLERLVLGQPADAPQRRGEIFAVDVLHRQEEMSVRLADVVHAADVRV